MKKLIDKRNYIILFIIVLLIIWIFFLKNNTYIKSFNFKDIIITYVIYDKIDSKKVSSEIKKIYKKYQNDSLSEKSRKYISDKTQGHLNDTKNYLAIYSTNEVLKYFKSSSIKKYMVNVDGDVILGDRYSSHDYSVSIHDPEDNSVIKIVHFSNKALSSISYLDLNDDRKDYDMVSVICDDIVTSNIVSNYLYYLSIDEGKEVLSKNECDGLWYKNGKIYTSSNFSKYFNKKL